MNKRIGVIGGGLVGMGTALQLQKQLPDFEIVVWEKEDKPGKHQSTRNSGVLHAGLYYKPGSAKARLAVKGIRDMREFCERHGIAHETCGKLVVACSEEELPALKNLFDRGTANGLTGLRQLNREQVREIEPHCAGIAAIQVPEEGIVDYAAVCQAMEREISTANGRVITKAKVRAAKKSNGTWRVETTSGDFEASYLVNCAGLHCDRICRLTGERPTAKIIPFRGEYYELHGSSANLVRHLIYPVPDAKFPFLGVHFTRMVHGGIEAGPNAVLAFAREGYKMTKINFADFIEASTFPGLLKFLARHPGMSFQEIARSLSKRLFCRSLQRLVPEVQEKDLSPGVSGVRAQAMTSDGTLVQDFHLIQKNRCLHVLNAPSPGATASLAIGEEIAASVCKELQPSH